MNKPKLILLYGFASSGKTTLAKKYLEEHPLAISIEGDQIISMMGQWRNHEKEAREIVFEHTKAIAKIHLKKGHDVLLPYLLINPDHVSAFESIAQDIGARFYEVYIDIGREKAIQRLLKRGVWGEEGSPELSEDDLPEINELYNTMETAMKSRGSVKTIPSKLNDVGDTYSKFVSILN